MNKVSINIADEVNPLESNTQELLLLGIIIAKIFGVAADCR